MDRLQSMRVFQRVVDEGGFAAAARKLDLAPAVVTRLVADLEAHLGVRLLQRTTRRVSLTPAGEAYLERLRMILSDIEEADSLAARHVKEMSGTLHVLSSPSIAAHLIAPALPAFQRLHPEVAVDLHVDNVHDPNVEEYDLALVSGDAPLHATSIVRTLAEGWSVFCASPAYLKRAGVPKAPQDLAGHRYLRLRSGTTRPRTLHVGLLADPSVRQEVGIEPVLVSNNNEAVLRATVEGGGVSAQPFVLVAPYIAAGALRQVLAGWIGDRTLIRAVLPSRKFLPTRTRAFLDHLAAHAGRVAQEAQPRARTRPP